MTEDEKSDAANNLKLLEKELFKEQYSQLEKSKCKYCGIDYMTAAVIGPVMREMPSNTFFCGNCLYEE